MQSFSFLSFPVSTALCGQMIKLPAETVRPNNDQVFHQFHRLFVLANQRMNGHRSGLPTAIKWSRLQSGATPY
jgi:hypothetical protein